MCQGPQGGASGPRTALNVWLPGGFSPETDVFTLGSTPGSLPEPSFYLFTDVGQNHLNLTIEQAQNSDPVGTWEGTRPLPQVFLGGLTALGSLLALVTQGLPDNLSPKGPQALACQGYDSGLVACEGLWLEQSKPPHSVVTAQRVSILPSPSHTPALFPSPGPPASPGHLGV